MASAQTPSLGTPEWDLTLLDGWLEIETNHRDKRRFLQAHPAIIDQRNVNLLQERIAASSDDPELLAMHCGLLQDILARHTANQESLNDAIADVYIDAFGGFTLDFPDWLTKVDARLSALRERRSRDVTRQAKKRCEVLWQAIARAQAEQLTPPLIAELHHTFWNARHEACRGESARMTAADISMLEGTLAVFTRARYPYRHSLTLGVLGDMYRARIQGNLAENLERAVACYESAIAACPVVRYPLHWALMQRRLATTLVFRTLGNSTENIQRGIICCTQALTVFTEATHPYEWAQTLNIMGGLFKNIPSGGERENIEAAIYVFREALRVFTLADYPEDYAQVQHNLGVALNNRIAGDRIETAELAMAALFAALQVYTKKKYPLDYAMTMGSLATVSLNRPAIDRRISLKSALAGNYAALRIYSLAANPKEYAAINNNLGLVYRNLNANHGLDIEMAIRCFRNALKVYTPNEFPLDHVMVLHNLSGAYLERQLGIRAANLEQAAQFLRTALGILATPETAPLTYRNTLLMVVLVEAERTRWDEVHNALLMLQWLEDRLLRSAAGEEARAALLKEDRDVGLRDGYALVRLGRTAEAAVAMERGRARGMSETHLIEQAAIERITDAARRDRFVAARTQLFAAQAALNTIRQSLEGRPADSEPLERHLAFNQRHHLAEAQYAQDFITARTAFDACVAEIRATNDPANFLDATLTPADLTSIAADLAPGHAIVYLAATMWGGVAVGVFSADPHRGTVAHYAALDLPKLFNADMGNLAQARLSENTLHIIGGFFIAQRYEGFKALSLPFWQGDTLRARAQSLAEICDAAKKFSTLSVATQRMLKTASIAPLADTPLATLTAGAQHTVAGTLNHAFMEEEIQASTRVLQPLAMQPLVDWLIQHQATGVTLIPCGFLETFPLATMVLADGRTVAETIPMSVAPNAGALRRDAGHAAHRQGVTAIGDPTASSQKLPWSETEAMTVAKLAREVGLSGYARVQEKAKRSWLIRGLNESALVDVSCHGDFNVSDFLRSGILLARGERLNLEDVFARAADLRGLRLLILSACQTSIPDVRGQSNEIRSFAGGMMQAGAWAVLASLWPVDDEATYVLVTRFAQIWLPALRTLAPAAALAQAQQWMRTRTYQQLLEWEPQQFTQEDLAETGVAPTWIPPSLAQVGDATHQIIAVRGGGNRFTMDEAIDILHNKASHQDPQVCPYAAPIFWAGFQIVGW